VAARAGWSVAALADAYLAGGAPVVQLRAKHAPSAQLLRWSEEVASRAQSRGAIAIVNDRPDIARLAGAAGVHVGQDDVEPGAVRRLVGERAVIGFSTHSLDQVKAAVKLPIDYIAVGPVFGTTTKDTGYSAVGLKLVRQAREFLDAQNSAIPLVAIGGMTLEGAADAIRAGAAAVAVISDLLATGQPEERARQYLGALLKETA
jgi:thiamine-phosphate diphosphorylase